MIIYEDKGHTMTDVSRTFFLTRAELEDLSEDITLRKDIIQLGNQYSLGYFAVTLDGVREVETLSDQETGTSEASQQFLLEEEGVFVISSYGRGRMRVLLNQHPTATHIQLTISGAIRPVPGSTVFPPTSSISPQALQDAFEKRDLQDAFILDRIVSGLSLQGQSLSDFEQELRDFIERESQIGRRVSKLNFADSADLSDTWTLVVRAEAFADLPIDPDDLELYICLLYTSPSPRDS